MDAEEFQRLLEQAQLRCLLLEADKEVEIIRAGKYRKILSSLSGEVAHPPVAGRSCPEGNETAAAVLEIHSDSESHEDVLVLDEGPRTGVSASTTVSQPGSKKRNLPSQENPTQVTSTRTLSRPSFDSDIRSQSSRTSISDSRSLGQGVSTPRNISIVVAGILKDADLLPLELTRAEATRVAETRGIGWTAFRKVFGGTAYSDWPRGARLPEYKNFLCADAIVQPYAPDAAGRPGLVFGLPNVIGRRETAEHIIHVLYKPRDGDLLYLGDYKKVPIPEVPIAWSDLSKEFQNRWIKRLNDRRKSSTRAIRARITLRNQRGREPSAMEVKAYIQDFDDKLTRKEVVAAFRSGKEKLVLEGLYCTGYNSALATIIQREAQEDDRSLDTSE